MNVYSVLSLCLCFCVHVGAPHVGKCMSVCICIVRLCTFDICLCDRLRACVRSISAEKR